MKWNWRTPLMVGGIGALLVLVLVVALILPKAGQIRTRQGDLSKAKGDENGLLVQLDELRGAAHEAKKNEAALKKLQTEVPEVSDLPGLIRQINGAADDAAVNFMSIAPAQPALVTDGKSSAISTDVRVMGTFFSVDEFLFRLETIPRVSRVTDLSMTSGEDGLIDVSFTALFFTTDLAAGPGSDPGPSTSSGVAAPAPSPSGGVA